MLNVQFGIFELLMTEQNTETQNVSGNTDRVFSTQIMYLMGCGDSHSVVFDFSIIPFANYYDFFNSLPNFIYKKCERITFSTDFYREYKAIGKHSRKREQLISESIMYNKPKYTHYLAKIIRNVLPKSKKLSTIEFRNINIDPIYIRSIFHAIGRSPSIKHVIFHGIAVTNELFGEFLESVSPYMINSIQFTSTKITNRCTKLIKNFINQKPRNNKIVRSLSKIVLDKDTFTQKQLQEIESMLIVCKRERDDWEENRQWQSDAAPDTNIPPEENKNVDLESGRPKSSMNLSLSQITPAISVKQPEASEQPIFNAADGNNTGDRNSSRSHGSSSHEEEFGGGVHECPPEQLQIDDQSTKCDKSDEFPHVAESSDKESKEIEKHESDSIHVDEPKSESQDQSEQVHLNNEEHEYAHENDDNIENSVLHKQDTENSPLQNEQGISLESQPSDHSDQAPLSNEKGIDVTQQYPDTQELLDKSDVSMTNT